MGRGLDSYGTHGAHLGPEEVEQLDGDGEQCDAPDEIDDQAQQGEDGGGRGELLEHVEEGAEG